MERLPEILPFITRRFPTMPAAWERVFESSVPGPLAPTVER